VEREPARDEGLVAVLLAKLASGVATPEDAAQLGYFFADSK
jgi:hypothetical protein